MTSSANPVTDAESAVGSCFEFKVLHLLQELVVAVEQAHQYPEQQAHPDGEDGAAMVTLRLIGIESRFDELPEKLDENFLYLLPNATQAIDCVAIIDEIKIEEEKV